MAEASAAPPDRIAASEEARAKTTGDPSPSDAQQQQEYFGFAPGVSTQVNFMFPDGVTYVTLSKLNEGGRSRYERAVRSDIVLEQRTRNARLQVDPARDRHALLSEAILGWNLIRGGQPVALNKRNIEDFLELTDPDLVDKIAEKARSINKWLESEMTVEDIDEEITRLTDLREEIKARDEGEDSSSSK